MKTVLIWGIQLYQKYLPNRYKRCCLFRESCSSYSIRKIDEQGAINGVVSTFRRIVKCRPGFKIARRQGELGIMLKNGDYVSAEKLSPEILGPYNKEALRISAHLNQ